jgi:RHS repeat-associated protein
MGTTVYTIAHGEVLSEKRIGVIRDLVPDSLGSTVALLDSAQAKSDTFSYWPYGEEAARTGTTPTPFRFVGALGYFRDSASRSYVRARHLDHKRARWSSKDPLGFDGGDENIYRYALGSPALMSDPSGLRCIKVPLLPICIGKCDKDPRCPQYRPDIPTTPCGQWYVDNWGIAYEGCKLLCNIGCMRTGKGKKYCEGFCQSQCGQVISGDPPAWANCSRRCNQPDGCAGCCQSLCHDRGSCMGQCTTACCGGDEF